MENVPGTNIEFTGGASVFERFAPFINAADGLSLGQVCKITGLEPFMIQNWVKRGFVPHPVNKKYGRRHLARILLISCLRDSMPIDRIGAILIFINGDTNDESDDIVTEDQLFDSFCLSLKKYTDIPDMTPEKSISETLNALEIIDETTTERLKKALTVMLYGYISGAYKRMSDAAFSEMVKL